MIFNENSRLAGKHSFLSASKPSWLNYDEEKLKSAFMMAQAAKLGTEKHELAHRCIKLGQKLPDTPKTIHLYVNDAIGFGMKSERILRYTDNCYGTADTISFRKGMLRIHDLKTGITPGDPRQLNVYAALFCLEYDVNPFDIDIELRIYQNNAAEGFIPDGDLIFHIMEKIKYFDEIITELRLEVDE